MWRGADFQAATLKSLQVLERMDARTRLFKHLEVVDTSRSGRSCPLSLFLKATGTFYETQLRKPRPRRWFPGIGSCLRTIACRSTRWIDRSVQRRFVHVKRDQERRLRGTQGREGLVRSICDGHRACQDSSARCERNCSCSRGDEERRRSRQSSHAGNLHRASGWWRSGPSLGEQQFQGLPLLGHQVLRQDQAGRVHDRNCSQGRGQSRRSRQGLFLRPGVSTAR